MKVLFCIRPNYLKNIAGDTVQLITMARYLCSRGVKVDINDGNIKDYSKYDIIHLFNLTRINETYGYYKTAKKSNKITVITPVYWDIKKYYTYTGSLSHIASWERNGCFREEIISGCSMIYPSSIKEVILLQKEFSENIPYTVINNCVEVGTLETQITRGEDHTKNSYILCAARICPRKNQLILAHICKDLGENLILAGEANNKKYLEKCLKFKNVRYAGCLRGNSLVRIYRNAKLHVLCSFVETPGLANLEAGACGCNIVSTSEGSAEEYFKDMALYCNPYDTMDIYNSVKAGLDFNKQPILQKHILQNYSAEKCLQPLYKSYFSII
jgi:glycosyltransferase involved in cell wall biosynthesis